MNPIIFAPNNTAEVPLKTCVDKKKLRDQHDDIPDTRKDNCKTEIEGVRRAASVALNSMPAKQQKMQSLAQSNAATVSQLQNTSKDMSTNSQKYTIAHSVSLQHLDELRKTVALINSPPKTLPNVPSNKPKTDFNQLYGNLIKAKVANNSSTSTPQTASTAKTEATQTATTFSTVCSALLSTGKRIKDIAQAHIKAYQIEHQDTADKHVATVRALKPKTEMQNEMAAKEDDLISKTYFRGYLRDRMEDDVISKTYSRGNLRDRVEEATSKTEPVFAYNENLYVSLSKSPGETYRGFAYSGSLRELFRSNSHEDILEGNYVRCKELLAVHRGATDVIITGTQDDGSCQRFAKAYFHDTVKFAAGSFAPKQLGPRAPLSDTPVIKVTKDFVIEAGDLAYMPDSEKRQIQDGNFIICDNFALRKTRLSNGLYKDIEAVITGTRNEEVCRIIYFHKTMVDIFRAVLQ